MITNRGIELRVTQKRTVIAEGDSEHFYFVHKYGGQGTEDAWVTLAEQYCGAPNTDGHPALPDLKIEYRAKIIPPDPTEKRRFFVRVALTGSLTGALTGVIISLAQVFGQ